MEDRYSSEFITNFLKRFEFDEGNKPPQQIQEQGGGGSTQPEATDGAKSAADIFKDAQAAGAEKTQQNKEKWAERRSAAKERAKSALGETRSVSRTITHTIKELGKKDVQGDIKKYIKEKVGDAKDRATGVKNYFSKENLLKNYDGITEKAVDAKNAVLDRTTEAAKGVLHRANERLITKPQEATKNFGTDVGRYFMNQGKNIADSMNSDVYGFKGDVMQSIADRYDAKATRKGRKENNILAKIEDAKDDNRGAKVSRLEKKLQRVAERRGKIAAKHEKYKSRADQARSAARDLRTGIGERNKQPFPQAAQQ